jgi:hypothetical protein
MASNSERRCGVGIRGVAMAIDSIIWFGLFIIVVTGVGFATGELESTSEGIQTTLSGGPALAGLALWLAVSILYHTLFEWRGARRSGSTSSASRCYSQMGSRHRLWARSFGTSSG